LRFTPIRDEEGATTKWISFPVLGVV
jgi:hypothetical protein